MVGKEFWRLIGIWIMKTMAIMIGIQASGKSRFCVEKLADYVRVNLDTLHTRNKENMAIEDAISRQVDLVIDTIQRNCTAGKDPAHEPELSIAGGSERRRLDGGDV